MEKTYTYQNTAQEIAGRIEIPSLRRIVYIVASHLNPIREVKNIVQLIVGIRVWLAVRQVMKLNLKCLLLKRANYQRITGYLVHYIQCGIRIGQIIGRDMVRNINYGSMQFSRGINILVRFVEISGQVVKSFVLTTLNHSLCFLNYDLILTTGGFYVLIATEKHQLMPEINYIRKRYAKFIGKEEEWEKITPLINR